MTRPAGTDCRDASGTAAVPVPSVPGTGNGTGTAHGSSPTGTGTGTNGTAGHGSSSGSALTVPPRRRIFRRPTISGRRPEPGTGTATGSVPVPVPVPVPSSPRHAAPDPEPAKDKIRKAKRKLFTDDRLLWSAIWAVTGVATWMAATGQVDVWTWAALEPTDTRRFGVPFLFEVGVIAWLLIGRHAVKNNRSPYPWWGIAAAFSALAVFTNAIHGDGGDAWRQGLIFGTASALSLALWFAKFYIDYIGSEIAAGLRSGAAPKVLLTARVIEQPRIRWRAHLIAGAIPEIKEKGSDGKTVTRSPKLADVIALASMWIEIYQDTKEAEKKRLFGFLWKVGDRQLAKRLAWREVKLECGVKVKQAKDVRLARVEFVRPELEEQRQRERAEQERVTAELEKLQREEAERDLRQRLTNQRRQLNNLDKPKTPMSPAPNGSGATPPPPPVAVDPEWFKKYGPHIALVTDAIGDWQARETPLTVDEVQALGKLPQYAGKGLSNRSNATKITACLKSLRADDNQTAGT